MKRFFLQTILASSALICTAQAVEKTPSTEILDITKRMVNLINSSSSAQDATNKLCQQKGFFRQGIGGLFGKDYGAFCSSTPHTSTIALFVCGEYPGFEQSQCAKVSKKALWPGLENKSLKELSGTPIKSIDTVNIAAPKPGNTLGRFKSVWDGSSQRTLDEEIKYYAAMNVDNNTKYLICKSDSNKLPARLKALVSVACPVAQAPARPTSLPGGNALTGVNKAPTQPDVMPAGQSEAKINTRPWPPQPKQGGVGHQNGENMDFNANIRPSLKDLDEGRGNVMLDYERPLSTDLANLNQPKADWDDDELILRDPPAREPRRRGGYPTQAVSGALQKAPDLGAVSASSPVTQPAELTTDIPEIKQNLEALKLQINTATNPEEKKRLRRQTLQVKNHILDLYKANMGGATSVLKSENTTTTGEDNLKVAAKKVADELANLLAMADILAQPEVEAQTEAVAQPKVVAQPQVTVRSHLGTQPRRAAE